MSTFDPKATGMDTPRARWKALVGQYSRSPELHAELMQRYFSPAFRQAHATMIAGQAASSDAYRADEQRRLRTLKGEREAPATQWTKLSAQARWFALLFGGAMIVLFIVGGVPELRRVGFDRSNPRVLRAGWRRYRVDWFTGVLSDYSSRREEAPRLIDSVTRQLVLVHPDDHRGPTETIMVITRTHEQFALVHPAGRYQAQVVGEIGDGFDSQGAFWREPGNQVTAVWVTGRRDTTGRFVLFHNWTKTRDVPHPVTRSTVDAIVAPSRWTLYPAIGLGFVIGSATGLFGDIAPRVLRGLLMAAIAAGIWLLLSKAMAALRRWRFERDELPRFSQLIDARDAAPADPATAP